jgi:4-diphosphocytidyl-2-C-methyl-D-erythritol kinase
VNSFSLPSFAKLNLFLEVKGRRVDGYHELLTVFQTVSLQDRLTFSPSRSKKIVVKCNVEGIPVDERNLVVQAAMALKESYGLDVGARIHLEKVIPAGGGLGGGSSNAAATLLGLCRLWDIQPGRRELAELACVLGADVPFFLYGGTAVGTGIGDILTPIRNVAIPWILIVTPPVHVSTGAAFKQLNAPALTKNYTDIMLSVSDAEALASGLQPEGFHNEFEPVIFRIKPEIERVKQVLIELGARTSMMSGSGSSVFGIFDNREAQLLALSRLKEEASWRVFPVSTVSREEYFEALGTCSAFLPEHFSD